MNKGLNFLFWAVSFWMLISASEVRAHFNNIHTFKLDNGLQVVVVENHKAPIVKQMLFYKTGSINEPVGKGGLAHLLEHLMFRGTKNISGQQFNDIMERNGAVSNAFTSQDTTAYHQFVDVSRLETVMSLEADRMQNLQIKNDDFEAERQIVFQERKQRIDNNPAAKFYEALQKTLWQNHPYARQVAGTDAEILQLSRQDAVDFYHRYYTPANAVLVLSGDVDEIKARELAQKYYGKINSRGNVPPLNLPQLSEKYKASISMELPDVQLGRMVNLYAVSSFNMNKSQVYAYELLAEYLGGDKNSPLYQKIVIQDKKALDIDVVYNPISRSYGIFEISLIPVDADENLSIWLQRAWNYAIQKLDVEQLEMIKQKLLSELVYTEDNPDSMANLVGYLSTVGVELSLLQDYVENIRNTTIEDILAIADKMFNNAPQVSGTLRPQKEDNNE